MSSDIQGGGSEDVVPKLALAHLSEKVKLKLDQQKQATKTKSKAPKDKMKDEKSKDKSKNPKANLPSGRADKKSNKHSNRNERGESNGADSSEDNGSAFLKEIEELGGSKEDLELINGLNDSGSESELEVEPSSRGIDSELAGDLSRFMKDIGLAVSDDRKSVKDMKNDKQDKTSEKPASDKKKGKNEPKESKKNADAKDSKKIESQAKSSTEILEELKQHPGELIIEPRIDWYALEIEGPNEGELVSQEVTVKLFQQAKEFLFKENERYTHDDSKSNSQKQFLSQLLTAGTLNDKIGAYTLLIRESPLHSMNYFESILGLCRKKSKSTAIQGVEALKDLFMNGVLPDRKLKWFKNQQITSNTQVQWLVLWAFEDWLKNYYFSLIQILEVLTHDAVPYIRTSSIVHIFDLLKSKPEQEVNLLKLVVNKLGDLDRKVASKVSYLLLQLEQAHPAMKAIIVDSISELIFQQGASYHSRYYAVITLNQTVLAHKDTEVANSLMRVYLSLFERLLAEWDSKKPVEKEPEKKKKKPRWKNKGGKGKHGGERQVAKTSEELKEDESTKLTSAVLTGLNRAFPFSDLPKDKLDKHLDTLYRVTHSANFNTSVQALILIHQVSRSQALLSDRFYKTLYESLLDPRLAASSKLRLYFNLLFKALKEDADVARSKAFAKRLMQMATSWLNIGVVSAIIYLLQELEKSIPKLRELMSGDQETSDSEDKKEEYDGRKRDPQFANADSSKLWEVIPFLLHFHPTVTLYSEGYVNSDTSLVKPDLTLHTLSHFLDRFVYRNPKQKPSTKGDSIMQPLAGLDNRSNIIAGVRGDKTAPINMADWSGMKLSDIDVSERFFHQYFTSREGLSKSKKPKKMNDSEDELDEDEVWKALVESRQDLEGEGSDDLSGFDDDKDGFSDEDIDFSDFSDDEVQVEGEDKESGSEKADVTAESDAEEEDEDDVTKSDDDEGIPDFEDSDAMLSSDAEIELDVLQSEVDEEGEETSKKGKRQHTGNDKKKSKRQRLKDLPEFASVEDYAEYLESSDEDYN